MGISAKPDRKNANKGTERGRYMVEASLRETGAGRSILLDKDDNIIAGNKTFEAASDIGLPLRIVETDGTELIAVKRTDLDLDDDTGLARKLAYYDNRASQVGLDWDAEQVLADINSGLDLSAMFRKDELDELLADLTPKEAVDAEPQIDKAEELRQQWGVEAGQMWQLGDHRLICGDCTDAAVVARVMGGDKINIAFTSPPYAEQRDYDDSSGFKPIPPSEYVQWFLPVSANVKRHLAHDGSWFVNIKPAAKDLDTELYVFDLVLTHVREWGWHFVTEFCWERNGIPKQVVRRFKNQFEPVYQFSIDNFKIRPDAVRHKSDNVPKARGKGAGNTSWAKHQGGESIFMSGMQWTPGFEWFGDNVGVGMAYPGNRLPTFASTHEATGHAAAFPVGLPQWFVNAYTDIGDVIYDPFMGSGSTLIAAENTQRKARGCELSPLYSAIILERWATSTGKTPVLLG